VYGATTHDVKKAPPELSPITLRVMAVGIANATHRLDRTRWWEFWK